MLGLVRGGLLRGDARGLSRDNRRSSFGRVGKGVGYKGGYKLLVLEPQSGTSGIQRNGD